MKTEPNQFLQACCQALVEKLGNSAPSLPVTQTIPCLQQLLTERLELQKRLKKEISDSLSIKFGTKVGPNGLNSNFMGMGAQNILDNYKMKQNVTQLPPRKYFITCSFLIHKTV